MCEVMLNSRLKHRTALHRTGWLWTGPCRAKSRLASPNHLKSVL